MKFSSVDSLIQQCEQHLDNTNTRNTHIESYFVQYLLVRICAEFEARIVILMQRRCARTADLHLREFAQRTVKYVCKKSAEIRHLADVLERFGPDYKTVFHDKTVKTTTAHVAWSNIYTNRHAVAHGVPPVMSLGDLKTEYATSLIVMEALATALALTPNEIQDLT
jgi:hypothetical protein